MRRGGAPAGARRMQPGVARGDRYLMGGVLVVPETGRALQSGTSTTKSGVTLNLLNCDMERRVGTTSWGSSQITRDCE